MRIKIAYIISHIDKALAFEWIASYLDKDKIELSFILLNHQESHLENFLSNKGIKVYRVHYLNKYNFISAFYKTRKILKQDNIDVVHAHLFDACFVGLLAARSLGIKRRIHTRHNSTIHHQYFPKAVKYDRFINSLSTDIIAISDVVKKVLTEMENVNPIKINLLHHGFDFSDIPGKDSDRVNKLRIKYDIENKTPVIGVISRYIHWKGVQFIIPAFQQLLVNYPEAKLILANADGPYLNEIRKLLLILPENSYLEIQFEPDVFALYKSLDVFIHTPIDSLSEAFGQTYVEALACEVPSVFTISGIAQTFIKDKKNALVVNYKSSLEITKAVETILSDSMLRQSIIDTGKKDANRTFGIQKMIDGLEKLYLN